MSNDARRGSFLWLSHGPFRFVLDVFIAFAAMRMAFAFSTEFQRLQEPGKVGHVNTDAAFYFAFLMGVSANIFGLYSHLVARQFWPVLFRVAGANLLALGIFAAWVFAVMYLRVGRWVLTQTFVYCAGLMMLAEYCARLMTRQHKHRLLLLGANQMARDLSAMVGRSFLPIEIIAPTGSDGAAGGIAAEGIEPAGLGVDGLSQVCRDHDIDEIVVCASEKLGNRAVSELMEAMNMQVRVSDCNAFVERVFFQVAVERIPAEWFLQSDLELTHPIYLGVKRTVDIAASLAGLLLTLPVLLVVVVIVKAGPRGPVLYSQIRAGQFGHPFRIWKLRSMSVNAEADGPQWAGTQDQRVTLLGRFLRKTRLDEVPQFWNILRGDMSLVGPRPERPEFVEKLAAEIPFYKQRHLVKPGLTGWAQINYPYGANVTDALNKLRYDLYYVKHSSLALDVQIMARTVGTIMKGAR